MNEDRFPQVTLAEEPDIISILCPACGARVGMISNDAEIISGRIYFKCVCGRVSVLE